MEQTDSGIYLPTKYNMEDIIQECSVVVALQETITRDQIDSYIKEKSNNLKIAADLFNCDSMDGVLNESGTHVTLKADGLTAFVPVEHLINYQYADLLSVRKRKK